MESVGGAHRAPFDAIKAFDLDSSRSACPGLASTRLLRGWLAAQRQVGSYRRPGLESWGPSGLASSPSATRVPPRLLGRRLPPSSPAPERETPVSLGPSGSCLSRWKASAVPIGLHSRL